MENCQQTVAAQTEVTQKSGKQYSNKKPYKKPDNDNIEKKREGPTYKDLLNENRKFKNENSNQRKEIEALEKELLTLKLEIAEMKLSTIDIQVTSHATRASTPVSVAKTCTYKLSDEICGKERRKYTKAETAKGYLFYYCEACNAVNLNTKTI